MIEISSECPRCGIKKNKSPNELPRELRQYSNLRGLGILSVHIQCKGCGSEKINFTVDGKLEIDSDNLFTCSCISIDCVVDKEHYIPATQYENIAEKGEEMICVVCRDECVLDPPKRLKNKTCPNCKKRGREKGFLTIRPGTEGNNDYVACQYYQGIYSKCSYYRELKPQDLV